MLSYQNVGGRIKKISLEGRCQAYGLPVRPAYDSVDRSPCRNK